MYSSSEEEKKEEYKKKVIEKGKDLVRRLEIPESEEKKGYVTKSALRNLIDFAKNSKNFEEFKLKSLYLVARNLPEGGEGPEDIRYFVTNLIIATKELSNSYPQKESLKIAEELLEVATMAFYARSENLDKILYG
ncbi:MAG: hypothetical protein ACP5IT_07390 [Thermoproteota archaeon]